MTEDAGGMAAGGRDGATDVMVVDAPSCKLGPLVVPPLPDPIPGYLELDPTTGLHVTGTYQIIDPATYRLKVTGKVDHPLSLTYDELRCLPKRTIQADIDCKGFFVDTAHFSGVRVRDLLDLAGVQADADSLYLTGADDYSSFVPLEAAREDDNSLIAYELEGQTLPILHGFPARALFPRMPGSTMVKWLLEIEVQTAH